MLIRPLSTSLRKYLKKERLARKKTKGDLSLDAKSRYEGTKSLGKSPTEMMKREKKKLKKELAK